MDYAGGFTQISGPEVEFAFDMLPSGKIALAGRGGRFISADYDANGALAVFRSGASAVEFGLDSMGRVSRIRRADGEVSRYGYDSLGNRASVDFGEGGAVRYTHDPSGNIVEVVVTEHNGEKKRQVVEIGDMNRVESIAYEGAGTLDIGYDRMGRAVRFEMGGEAVVVEYEGPGRIGRIVSETSGAVWAPEEEESARQVQDARLEVIHGDSTGASHPDYGIVGFDEVTFGLFVDDPMERGVPGLREARQLFAVAEPLLFSDGNSAMTDFQKPSNPVFQPLEYRSTNCCIPSAVALCFKDGDYGNLWPWWQGSHPTENGSVLCFCWPYFPPQPRLHLLAPPSPWYIDKETNMPTITLFATWLNVQGNAPPATYEWVLKAEFKGDVETVTESTSADRWILDWGDRKFGGDVTVTVSAEIDGEKYSDSRSGYKIHGLNPDKSQLAGHVASPWFFSQMIREESSCLHFLPSGGGEVHVSSDNGFGFAQLTNPRPTAKQKWDWQANLEEAESRLDGMETEAEDWWDKQKKQWETYNAKRKMKNLPEEPHPPDRTYGDVTFGYSGSGKKLLKDGIWIKMYRGANPHWLVWENHGEDDGVAPTWEYNDKDPSYHKMEGYVSRVVKSTPCH